MICCMLNSVTDSIRGNKCTTNKGQFNSTVVSYQKIWSAVTDKMDTDQASRGCPYSSR